MQWRKLVGGGNGTIGGVRCGERLLVEPGDDRLAHDLAEERFFVREVEIDGPFGDPGPAGDVFQSRADESVLAEDFEGGLKDLVRAFVGSAASGGIASERHLITDWSVIF